MPSNAEGMGLIPRQGAKSPHASWPKYRKVKQKRYCNKFNEDLKKNSLHPKSKSLKKKKNDILRRACKNLKYEHNVIIQKKGRDKVKEISLKVEQRAKKWKNRRK